MPQDAPRDLDLHITGKLKPVQTRRKNWASQNTQQNWSYSPCSISKNSCTISLPPCKAAPGTLLCRWPVGTPTGFRVSAMSSSGESTSQTRHAILLYSRGAAHPPTFRPPMAVYLHGVCADGPLQAGQTVAVPLREPQPMLIPVSSPP